MGSDAELTTDVVARCHDRSIIREEVSAVVSRVDGLDVCNVRYLHDLLPVGDRPVTELPFRVPADSVDRPVDLQENRVILPRGHADDVVDAENLDGRVRINLRPVPELPIVVVTGSVRCPVAHGKNGEKLSCVDGNNVLEGIHWLRDFQAACRRPIAELAVRVFAHHPIGIVDLAVPLVVLPPMPALLGKSLCVERLGGGV
mmetsp:Transcript_10100/g.30229  ORF Transcript_10100/g.30229 Transcript_10100/m.30229 type:complete len:201 (-) Transcript_10100:306-908(-)